MARRDFKPENRVNTSNRVEFPKLSLKKGERARIVFIDGVPECFYVHTLRAPVADEFGVPQKETKQNRNNEDYEVQKTKFVSNPLCEGNDAVLDEEGIDPKNCTLCAAAEKFPTRFQAPTRRYANHVMRYRTKAGSFELTEPFAVETLVWTYSDTKYNTLYDIAQEHGDIRKKDLLLGPCSNETFQNFDIAVGSTGAWLESQERTNLTKETLVGSKLDDLSVAAGRTKAPRFLELDIKEVNDAWAVVDAYENRGKAVATAPATATSLGEDLSGLIDDVNEVAAPAQAEPAQKETPAVDDLDGLLDNETVDTSTGEVTEKPAEAPKAAAPKEDSAPSLDDLLDGL